MAFSGHYYTLPFDIKLVKKAFLREVSRCDKPLIKTSFLSFEALFEHRRVGTRPVGKRNSVVKGRQLQWN